MPTAIVQDTNLPTYLSRFAQQATSKRRPDVDLLL